MTSREVAVLQTAVANVIALRAGPGADTRAVAAAARRTYDDLTAVLVPLISRSGVDALVARALHLTTQEYPMNPGEEEASGPFGRTSLWLERQEPDVALAAATSLIATFADLLATLFGESLTTRYLRKAWPDEYSETRPEGKET